MFRRCFKKVRLWLKATQGRGICYIFIKSPGKWCGLLPKEDKEDRFNLMNRWRLALLLAQT